MILGKILAQVFMQSELNWSIKHEWVSSAEDFVWRRTRRGLLLSADQVTKINNYVELNRVKLTT